MRLASGITSEYSAKVCLLVSSTYYCYNLVLYAATALVCYSPGEVRRVETRALWTGNGPAYPDASAEKRGPPCRSLLGP